MIAVVTIVRGRHDHLAHQQEGLLRSQLRPALHVVVAMDDHGVDEALVDVPWDCEVVHVPAPDGRLPLAAARNAGARVARARGASVLVFLDADCIPGPCLLGAYERAAADPRTARDLLSGPVTYLPPAPAGGYDLARLEEADDPHPARPAPAPGEVLRSYDDHELFWSLSFAVSPAAWAAIGGFDEAYSGYGGEDTDFAFRARRAGVALTWVGSARAFHQHHPVSSPPVEHVADIVCNGRLFADRWGEWPMRGWLEDLQRHGLVERDGSGWRLV